MPCHAWQGVCDVFLVQITFEVGSKLLPIQLSQFWSLKTLKTLAHKSEKLQICSDLKLSVKEESWHVCFHWCYEYCVKISVVLVKCWKSCDVLSISSYSEKTAESWLFGHFCIALTCGVCFVCSGIRPEKRLRIWSYWLLEFRSASDRLCCMIGSPSTFVC